MKRILLAIAIASASLATMSSCTKEYYDMVPSKTMIYERSANQWQGTGNRKYIDLPVKELTSYYLQQGVVSVAMSTDNETSYQAIPATIDAVSFSYDYVVGSIRVYAEDPIMETGVNVTLPANAVFKISLTDADFVE